MGKFKKIFRGMADPRAANAVHPLLEVLFIAFAAVLCGAEGPSDMERFGRSKEGLLRQILRLENGIPSHDTFGRVFQALDPRAFERAFLRFMVGFAKFNKIDLTGVLAIDGKALRGAYERGCSTTPLQMVNVFAVAARMSLASRKAPGRNEAAAAVEVLQAMCLKHCTITADALHCHRGFAATVLEQGGDYVLALKANQSKLHDAVVRRFARAGTRSVAEQFEPSTHDRHEWRRATVMRDNKLAILSNGSPEMLDALVRNSGLDRLLDATISVDARKIFKPSPEAYELIGEVLATTPDEVLFVSSNPWDVAGAKSYGLNVAWIERVTPEAMALACVETKLVAPLTMFKAIRTQMDELGFAPDHRVRALSELPRIA